MTSIQCTRNDRARNNRGMGNNAASNNRGIGNNGESNIRGMGHGRRGGVNDGASNNNRVMGHREGGAPFQITFERKELFTILEHFYFF